MPPPQRLGNLPTQKLRHQGSADKTPTPTQQAHLKKIKSQTSEDEAEKRKDTALQRQILFDELEEVADRIEVFKADAKSENISVQGAIKFEKIVNFNKQLRQFKKVHDRNKIICQESLKENSDEEQNFIPAMPHQKELSNRYKTFEKPKLTRVRSEKMMQDFHEKHKKLTAAFEETKQQFMEDKAKEISPPQDKVKIETSNIQSSIQDQNTNMENMIKSQCEVAKSEKFETDSIQRVSNINLLSTTIDDSFENVIDETEVKDSSANPKANIRQLIMKFETTPENEQKSDSGDSDANVAKNGKESFLSNKQKFLDVFTRTTPIFSSIDDSWSPTNSMNQEVINFQEELLNFEADSLNPPDENTKRISLSNAKAERRLSFEQMEAENFVKERNKLKESNEKNSAVDNTVLQRGLNYFSQKLSDNTDKHHNFGVGKITKPDDVKSDQVDQKPVFQNGFLYKSEKKSPKENDYLLKPKEHEEEKKTSPKISITSEFKHRFLSSFSFEKPAQQDSLESSIFGSSSAKYKPDEDKSPRKKSVHFEADKGGDVEKKVLNDSLDSSPIQSYFPIIDSILQAGPSKTSDHDDVGKISNGVPLALNPLERSNDRKESISSIETIDTVDLELIQLGMHKSSGDIRNQYLSKLHITSPPSSLSMISSLPSSSSYFTSMPSSSAVMSSSNSATLTTTAASDQYTELLRNEEKITEQHAKLATQFEKSNVDMSNPVVSSEDKRPPSSTTPPMVMGPRARPPLRPMFMIGGGHMGPPVRMRGMSPRMRFPPPPYMLRGGSRGAPGETMRMSPPPRNMAFFR